MNTNKIYSILIALVVVFLLISPIFIRVRIQCVSQFGECPQELTNKLKSLNDNYLFKVKKGSVKILKSDLLVSSFSTQFKLPNTLVVNIIAKKPEFSVFDKNQNKYLLVDSTGIVLTLSDKSDLPYIIKDQETKKSGEKITDNDLFALKLIQGINQMYAVGSGVTQNDTLVVDLPGAVRVILPLGNSDIQVLLGSLRLIYTKVTTSYPGIYSQIDMRFKNPVIR